GLRYVLWESEEDDTIIARTRNFYGVLTVTEDEPEKQPGVRVQFLKHGGVLHGAQYLEDARAMTALTYYGRGSGIEHALQALPDNPARRIGVVGLGAGTMAAYGRAGDTIRVHPLKPQMIPLGR